MILATVIEIFRFFVSDRNRVSDKLDRSLGIIRENAIISYARL